MNQISRTYRILSLALAFLMFNTSVGFTLDMHLCQGHLRSFSLLGKARNCAEMAGAESGASCTVHAARATYRTGCEVEQQGCCTNRSVHVQNDQNRVVQNVDVHVSSVSGLTGILPVPFFRGVIHPSENNHPAFSHYRPPLILRDIPVFVQSFRL